MSAHVFWIWVSVTSRSKRHDHPEIARSVLGGLHNLKLNRRRQAAQRKDRKMTRYEIARSAFEHNSIEADTFGQLHGHNFSNKIIAIAVERKWISAEFAAQLLDANIEDEDDMNRKRIEGQIVTCNGKIAYYNDIVKDSIKAIQKASDRLTPDCCSEAESIQADTKRILVAKAHIDELSVTVAALKFMLDNWRGAPRHGAKTHAKGDIQK